MDLPATTADVFFDIVGASEGSVNEITVVGNWFEELKRLAPVEGKP